MTRVYSVAIGLGALLAAIGTAGQGGYVADVVNADTLAGIYVGATQSNHQCKAPEPDCPDANCYACGSKCCHKDDWEFSEQNYCIPSSGSTCNLTDYQSCYRLYSCQKNPLESCTGSTDCTSLHSPCDQTDYSAYDDCSTT